jgi:two-component system phosphate regulon sensor histidine kinase PhoR
MKRKSWFNPPLFVLMSLSLVALLSFLTYWLWQSYESEKLNLRRETNFVLMRAARMVEDSLIRDSYGDLIDREDISEQRIILSDSLNYQSFSTKLVDTSQVNVSFIKRRGKPPMDSKGRRNFPGTIGLHLKGVEDMNPHLVNQLIGKLLVSRLAQTLEPMNMPSDIKLNYIISDSSRMSNSIYSTIYSDIVTGMKVNLVVSDYRKFLLQKIWPEILVALVLFTLTFLTVLLLYRNILIEKALSNARKDLMANISHELKTPITSVNLAMEAMQTGLNNEEKRSEYLSMASAELARLSDLVDRIMQGVAPSSGIAKIKEYHDLVELTRKITSAQNLLIERMNGEVELILPDAPVIFKMDKMQITSVINNLLDNALKYSQPEPKVKIEVQQDSRELRWRITDNGCGIPNSYQKQVFENLFRVPKGNVHNVKGFGLGLHYVKQVIEGHGGHVHVLSDGRNGTTVEFYIKRDKA